MKANRSDVDKLGDIRAEIRALEAEEAVLRDRIIQTEQAKVTGDDYVATIKASERRTLDTKAVLAWYGEQELARFMRTSEMMVVSVKSRREA